MKSASVLIRWFCVANMFLGCMKSNPTPPPPGQGTNPPTVSGISPDSGIQHTSVSISGTNFGADTSTVKVFFNGLAASIQTITDTKITVFVPAHAKTGVVVVEVNGRSVQGPVFTYLPSVFVSTIAGNGQPGSTDGIGTAALFSSPRGITADSAGNIYVADFENRTIRKITPAGVVSTIAGSTSGLGFINGTGSNASFNAPNDISLDPTHNILYVLDGSLTGGYNNQIRTVSLTGTVAYPGNDTIGYRNGPIGTAFFSQPYYLHSDAQGNLVVTDAGNFRIRAISAAGTVTTLAGNGTAGTTDGPGGGPTVGYDYGITSDANGNVFFTEHLNNSVRKLSGGNLTTLAGGTAGQGGQGGYADGTGGAAQFSGPTGIVADGQGNLYVADIHNLCIRKITSTGVVTTIAGKPGQPGLIDGDASVARFDLVYGITIDSQGNLYVADYGNNAIRKITFE